MSLDANHLHEQIRNLQHTTPWTMQLKQNTTCSLIAHTTTTTTTTRKMFQNSLRSTNRSLNSENAPGSIWVPTWCLATNATRGLLFIINQGKYASSQKILFIPNCEHTFPSPLSYFMSLVFLKKWTVSLTYLQHFQNPALCRKSMSGFKVSSYSDIMTVKKWVLTRNAKGIMAHILQKCNILTGPLYCFNIALT